MAEAKHSPQITVSVSETPEEAGATAGRAAADVLARCLETTGHARVVFASAPSQEQMLAALGTDERIDWTKVRSFHMDDYLGLDPAHPASFGNWLTARLPEAARSGLERIDQTADPVLEIQRYGDLIAAHPVDLVCFGIGVNGHIAFNEPGDTTLDDPAMVREVALSPTSRGQQVDDGLFKTLNDVPTHALTLTVPPLLRARAIVGTVLGDAKAPAVAKALTGPITADVPASAIRTHPNASIHLDAAAARGLPHHPLAR